MPTLREQFGSTVRALRLDKDWTQEETAERLGVSLNFYNAIERGLRSPSFDTLEIFAATFEVAVARLFEPVSDASRIRVSRATHGKK